MGDSTGTLMARRGRLRGVLLVICALVLFLAGLFLLFAPAVAQPDSKLRVGSSPVEPDRWIMGAQSREPVSFPGG